MTGGGLVRTAAIASVLLATVTACHTGLPALAEKQRWDEIVARVGRSRVEPRGRAARAHATALAARGDFEAARAVLLRDHRRGGDPRSLLMLADLERRVGRLGAAAAHYGRALSIAPRTARIDAAACELLTRRSAAFFAEGEALAAAADLERVAVACPARTPIAALELARRRDEVERARRHRQELLAAHRPCKGRCPPPSSVRDTLATARATGPGALRRTARMLEVELPPEDLARLLAAELAGELGPTVVGDDEVRAWLGDQRVADVEVAFERLPPEASAYAWLRLSRIIEVRGADGRPAGAEQRRLWALRVSEGLGSAPLEAVRGFRALLLAGDVVGADLAVTVALRSLQPPEAGASPAAREPRSLVDRVALDPRTLTLLATWIRFRDLAGHEVEALEHRRALFARAFALGVPGAETVLSDEIARILLGGRPLHALAVLEAVNAAAARELEPVAASASWLSELACEGRCLADAEAVATVLGEAWVAARRAGAGELALGRAAGRPRSGCATLAELLVEDPTTPLGRGLATALIGDGSARDGARIDADLAIAIESDPTLHCAGRHAVPLLARAPVGLSAATLSDLLAHGDQPASSGFHGVLAELALALGLEDRALLHARAAAALDVDPRHSWARAAEAAATAGRSTLTRVFLRELFAHAPAHAPDPSFHLPEELAVRRALVLSALAEFDRTGGLEPAERESIAASVAAYLDALPEEHRHRARDRLALALGRRAWTRTDRRTEIANAVLGGGLAERHPQAARLLGLLAPAPASAPDPLDPTRAVGGSPGACAHLCDTIALIDGSDVALLDGGREPAPATLIGLAVVGPELARARALSRLRTQVPRPRRAALGRFLDREPAAYDPDRPAIVGMVPDPDLRFRVVFALDLDPAALRR